MRTVITLSLAFIFVIGWFICLLWTLVEIYKSIQNELYIFDWYSLMYLLLCGIAVFVLALIEAEPKQ